MNSQVDLHHTASDCPNCGAHVSGNFCHECGQETVLHPPSTREFLHEFVGHYVALEGKLLQTMKLLLLKPGQLSLEYMQGRRVRYIEPLRVYLTFSLIFFAVFKFMGEDHHIGGVKLDGAPVVKVDPQDKKKAASTHPPAATAAKPDEDESDDPPAMDKVRAELRKDEALQDVKKDLGKDNAGIVETIEKIASAAADDDGAKLKKVFFGSAPYAVFAMMPLFALYLKILYLGTGKRYGEHLLFALHTNAFAFLMLTLLLVIPSGVPWVGKLLGLWLTFYLPTAMRRVYGGSRKMTALRWIVLMFLHLLTLTVAISVTVGVGASH
ncbi:hypothetical protein SRABI118_02668 [Massilia sp. Bi118]|uniref:DUF3667 domain-containing protein n=1 Tax=Massilia sp. Bi118 TaxID=2822346 RepID=UPI001DAE6683|nr:DUF3667 domain-containing protein [Massilia sp. Bi118]CAH0239115.1 hypothetical protein SRABI118_02668 [Massilia sp. Bi118]